ncbi:hypothetical protein ISCGN_007907 [Ixodes scapularis]
MTPHTAHESPGGPVMNAVVEGLFGIDDCFWGARKADETKARDWRKRGSLRLGEHCVFIGMSHSAASSNKQRWRKRCKLCPCMSRSQLHALSSRESKNIPTMPQMSYTVSPNSLGSLLLSLTYALSSCRTRPFCVPQQKFSEPSKKKKKKLVCWWRWRVAKTPRDM